MFPFFGKVKGSVLGGVVWLIVGFAGIGALLTQYLKGVISVSPHDTDLLSVAISLVFFAAAAGAGVLLVLRKRSGVILMLVLSCIWLLYVCSLLMSFSGLVPREQQFFLLFSLAIPVFSVVAGLGALFLHSRPGVKH